MRNYLIILLAFFVCTNINAQVKKTVSKQQKAELLIERFMILRAMNLLDILKLILSKASFLVQN